ncbi:nicotinate-nucleotide adenylyltransferase [Fusobacterium sp.]|uniref:nicotinate-nucleotide adenylyltransferase n=1 Tax=Fusobacterium sp. TaxID=68766 RepID=UPI002900374E|nr:nicotinate-nucleotide adenylyltransferase [Fusobacterium sp.]MDU1909806.1 nicotinate-nucleotide adenylyltransferase [Fusobacterium sp.]
MKIGIYGGSFNPVHNGHLNIVKYVLNELKLDKIIVIPVGRPSHKADNLELGALRIEMCKAAFENLHNVEVSDIETDKDKISYTINTLKKIIKIYGKKNDFYEIIGEDSAYHFKEWKNYEEILQLSKVVVLRRKGYIGEIQHENMIYLESPFFNVSSTEIREKIKNKIDITNLVPKKVKKIIEKNNLYK